MTGRELFQRLAHFETKGVLFIPSRWQWFWGETLDNWVEEGAPPVVKSFPHNLEYFGFDRVDRMPIKNITVTLGPRNTPPIVPAIDPFYERKILEEKETHQIIRDEGGRKCKVSTNHPERMPQFLEYPVKNRDDWEKMKERFDPHTNTRFPAWWEDQVKEWKVREYPLGLPVGSFFGILRELLGFKGLCRAYYKDPDLIHDMCDHFEYFFKEVANEVLKDVTPDFAYYWEDMAYKSGSMISPELIRKFMLPHYKEVNKLLREKGIDIILVDSDGDISEIIPLWLEAGINGFYPLEVASGMDAVKLREKYGEDIILIGNIDKRALIKGKEAIRNELEYKIPPLISKGGYFPAIDHFVPPDVSFENYQYYLKALREIASGVS